jgi:alpha-L-rhamnosidase
MLKAKTPGVFLLCLTICRCACALSVDDLRCEGISSPLNVDALRPVLSWKLQSGGRGERETAYQVVVEPGLWDSGRIAAGGVNQIAYAGRRLVSGETCNWKVRAWDAEGRPSDWSSPATFSMGLLSPRDWKAKWIRQAPGAAGGPMPMFRRTFSLGRVVSSAVIYICGLGQFDLQINGKAASADVLQPGWTDYKKTCLYCAYDVTGLLRQGENAIGVMLGNGMYDVPADRGRYHKFVGSFGPPRLIAQLDMAYSDGSEEVIGTDSSWEAAAGPITFSSIYGGEDYDARLAEPSVWSAAVETAGPGGTLFGSTHSAPPIRVAKIVEPVGVTHPRPGVAVYDLGQNCAEMPLITVSGSAGDSVRLTPAEVLNADGTVNQAPSGRGCYYQYTLDGSGTQTWSPRFCYYGSRYLQAEGTAKIEKLEGRFITSSSPEVGEFSCSNDLFNRTAAMIRWAMRSNMMSILTDCPHREKLGWLEQDHLMGRSLTYNYDLQSLLRKVCDDMSDAQRADGMVPDIAPEYTVFKGGFRDSPEWGSAAVLIPWNLYQWYGDRAALAGHYDMMRRYVAYLSSRADGGIVSHGLGDWYDIGPKAPGIAQLTPIPLTATAFYCQDLKILAEAAAVLGREDEASGFARQAARVRAAFNARFFKAEDHRYATGSQTADALALSFGMADAAEEPAVLADLVSDIQSRGNSLTAGDVGYRYVLRALADGGRSDVIFDMNSRSDRPGYGWQLDHGATSLTEAWDASQRSSQDHFMLGHIMEWFYSDLAGIQNGENSIGFEHIVIKPTPVGDVTWAKASFESVRGLIESSWRIEGGRFKLDVTIPCGSDAVVYLPSSQGRIVEGVWTYLGTRDGKLVMSVKSGKYSYNGKY